VVIKIANPNCFSDGFIELFFILAYVAYFYLLAVVLIIIKINEI